MKLFRKPNSKFYWYDFTVPGFRYRGSTQETKSVSLTCIGLTGFGVTTANHREAQHVIKRTVLEPEHKDMLYGHRKFSPRRSSGEMRPCFQCHNRNPLAEYSHEPGSLSVALENP